jgi:integrase/recombinase XerD
MFSQNILSIKNTALYTISKKETENMVNISIHDFETLIKTAESYLSSQKYSPITANNYARIWRQAMNYAISMNTTHITDKTLDSFVNDTYGMSEYLHPTNSKERGISRPLVAIFDFKETGKFSRYYSYHPEQPVSSVFLEIMETYRVWLIVKGQRMNSINTKLFRLKVFFRTIESYGIKKPEDISYGVFIRFMGAMKNNATYRINILRAVKDFASCPSIQAVYGLHVPQIHSTRENELPSFFTEEESSQILSSIDRSTIKGKKDYVMLILALQYGIRISDILALKISDFDWEMMKIAFYQKKTGKYISLPITDTIKWAILDYMMNSRCQDASCYLFLKSKAPHTPYADNTVMHAMITKYVKLAHINTNGRHHGMHSLRHSAASRMLNGGVPLNIVSEILGHSSMEVTEKYLKISMKQLRSAGLEVSYYVQQK